MLGIFKVTLLIFQECNSHRVSASVPRVLVGNKCDLVDKIQVGVFRCISKCSTKTSVYCDYA